MNRLPLTAPLCAQPPRFVPLALQALSRALGVDSVAALDVTMLVFAGFPARHVMHPVPGAVSPVLASGTPAKVTESVVRGVVVAVQRLLAGRARADEYLQDQPVHQPQHRRVAELHLPVASSVVALLQASTVSPSPNPTLIGNVVTTLESRHRAPMLGIGIAGRRNAGKGRGHECSITRRTAHNGGAP